MMIRPFCGGSATPAPEKKPENKKKTQPHARIRSPCGAPEDDRQTDRDECNEIPYGDVQPGKRSSQRSQNKKPQGVSGSRGGYACTCPLYDSDTDFAFGVWTRTKSPYAHERTKAKPPEQNKKTKTRRECRAICVLLFCAQQRDDVNGKFFLLLFFPRQDYCRLPMRDVKCCF
jgi:hypothetical protein